jgi:hypothetical protein
MATREADIQKAIVDALGLVGFECLEVGKVRRAVVCPDCGGKHFPTGWQGNTPGTPDLMVGLASGFPLCTWVGLELKRPTHAKTRPEQLELWQRGRTAIVRSPREALEDLHAVVRSISEWQAPGSLLEALERIKHQV